MHEAIMFAEYFSLIAIATTVLCVLAFAAEASSFQLAGRVLRTSVARACSLPDHATGALLLVNV
jgi:hypothetical protein